MGRVEAFIRDFIQREYTIPDDVDILSLDYVEAGYVDSMGIIQFIVTLEDEFDITFTDEELNSPDAHIVGKLVKLIESKLDR